MKTITNDFKEEISKLARQIDFKFFLHTNDKLITEDGKFIMTQDNLNLIVEQLDDEEIDLTITSEDIYNIAIVNKGNLLSTMLKEIDFEIKQDLRVGDIIECSFGLKIDDDYEYINFGKYVINTKEHNEDTNTYSYTAFDGMMLSMITADDLSIVQNKTIQEAIENVCEKVGLEVNITQQDIIDYPNLTKIINSNCFSGMEMTYRDILDIICQCLGLSMITNNKTLLLKSINRTPVDTFDEYYLKNTNVKFGEKYGPINSVVLSRSEDNDTIYRRDENSISVNGLHEFKIKDNLIMLYDDREDYIDEIFNQLNGLEYYINDYTSTGITYLDWLDMYNVEIGDKAYNCLMLNDEIKISQGLEESIYTEKPEETTTQYKTSSKTDKEVSFIVDKQGGEIKAKVSKGDVINEINLDTSGASINAEKISLEGKEINLTSDEINIASTNFSVDKDGVMTAKSGKIANWNIDDNKGLYNGTGTSQAGIGIYGKTYAFWAGSEDSGSAPFRVGHGGNLTCTDASIQGTISGSTISGSTLNGTIINGAKIDINTSNITEGFIVHSNNNTTAFEIKSMMAQATYNGQQTIALAFGTGSVICQNLSCSGSKNRIVKIDNGKIVKLNAYETATPYFGDIGSNKTNKNGECKIEIEEIFGQTIERDDYKVFIQECGEGHLYVEKHKDYFLVKGTPNLDFDWELKAIQKGYANVRLEEYKKEGDGE